MLQLKKYAQDIAIWGKKKTESGVGETWTCLQDVPSYVFFADLKQWSNTDGKIVCLDLFLAIKLRIRERRKMYREKMFRKTSKKFQKTLLYNF